MKTARKGFTVVELVIVIAVIAILAAVLIPLFSNVIQNSRDSSALQRAKHALDIVTADELGLKETKYSFAFTQSGEDYVYIYDNTATGDKTLKKGTALTGNTVAIINTDLEKMNVTVLREKAADE